MSAELLCADSNAETISTRARVLAHAMSETPWAIIPSQIEVIAANGSLGGGSRSRDAARIETVANLPLYGLLLPRTDAVSVLLGATSLERWSAVFRELVDRDEVGAVVLDVDSPGGSTSMVMETAAIIRDARGSKPIVAVVNTVAGSAAYWLASQCDEVVVSPSGSAGSIGVFAAHTDISGAQEQAGIKTTLIASTPEKVELAPFAPLSDAARAAVQDMVDVRYAQFVSDVALGRGVSEAKVRSDFGQGRMLLADEAVSAGMADRVGTLDDTVDSLLGSAVTPSVGTQAGKLGARRTRATQIAKAPLSTAPRGLYSVVSESSVPDDVRSAVIAGITYVCASLGADLPSEIVWFKPREAAGTDGSLLRPDHWFMSEQREADGFADPPRSAVYIRADITPERAVEVGAHETFHLFDPSATEDTVTEFGEAARDLLARRGRVSGVHCLSRSPLKTQLLAGVAADGDVAIAPDTNGQGREVYINFGSRLRPEWRRAA